MCSPVEAEVHRLPAGGGVLEAILRLVGSNRAVEILGVKLVGVTAENGRKLLFTLAFILMVVLLVKAGRWLALRGLGSSQRALFWSRQGMSVGAAVLLVIGIGSIWFDDPGRLATGLGLVTAGLAFALQRVVTAVAGYGVILRGRVFNVGDRILMGGVRGDVISLSFLQTTIMEMGQPPAAEQHSPAAWVRSRQYTGRIVTVSNARLFDEPVYNYTRELPWLWEELRVPVRYGDDYREVERLLIEAAQRHTVMASSLAEADLRELARRSFLEKAEVQPRVYQRITDNWLELTVLFVVPDRGIREVKDAIARDVLAGMEAAGIEVASATVAVTRRSTAQPVEPGISEQPRAN